MTSVIVVELHFVIRLGSGHGLLTLRTESGLAGCGQQRLLCRVHGFVEIAVGGRLGIREHTERISIPGVGNADVVSHHVTGIGNWEPS